MAETRDKIFRFAVIIKAIDGALEIFGGLLLSFMSVTRLSQLAVTLTQHELSEDPHDFIATHVLHSAGKLTAGSKWFGVAYLLVHGVVKLGLATALLRQLRWAYKPALIVLSLSAVYQIYRVSLTHSVTLAIFTTIDMFIIWAIWQEAYGKSISA